MKPTWCLAFIGALNIMLLISNGVLVEAVRQARVGEALQTKESEAIRAERERLDALRSRIDDRLNLLASNEARLKEVRESAADLPKQRGEDGMHVAEEEAEAASATTQPPDPLSIPLLTQEEEAYLDELRSEMPTLSESPLLGGDLDALLKDRDWNPSGRELSGEEKASLGTLLKDYRFFARVAPYERLLTEIVPCVARMRESGAYVEYGPGEEMPSIPGVTLSHGEMVRDKPGFRRIYYFYPQDYPGLYHRRQVETERSYEAFLKIYHLINKTL